MKNKILSIFILTLLSLPVQVQAENDFAEPETAPVVEETVKETTEVLPSVEESEFKQPVSKRKIAKKFLLAMGGVAVSSFLIFFGLTLYNKVREGLANQVKTPEGETSLETPDDLESAVKSFLDKTNWG